MNLSLRTPLEYGQFTWSRENAHTFFVKITSIIWTLYNTDNGHEISAPERKFIQTEPLYYGHSNDDSSYSTRFPVCRYISECNQLSHCSYDNSIMFSIGKNYTIDMSLPFIIKISYSLKTLQLLLSFFYLFSFRHFHLKDYLYGQLGFL